MTQDSRLLMGREVTGDPEFGTAAAICIRIPTVGAQVHRDLDDAAIHGGQTEFHESLATDSGQGGVNVGHGLWDGQQPETDHHSK
ncbi:hypothetical protein D9M69_706050 [compost metagenome]